MTWAPNRSASCPAISRRASFDRSSAMLTITVAYVMGLSCVTIDQSLLGSKSGKTTEIDQVTAPLIGEIIPQCWKMLARCLLHWRKRLVLTLANAASLKILSRQPGQGATAGAERVLSK